LFHNFMHFIYVTICDVDLNEQPMTESIHGLGQTYYCYGSLVMYS
jgi:hypothetical protein